MLSNEVGQKLIRLARDSIADYYLKRTTDLKEYGEFSNKQGVFVTITKEDKLRGCIGFPEPVSPLNKAIVEAARAAAFQDPRFKPLKQDEFTQIAIEISVLTTPQLIRVRKPEEYRKEIKIGKDGLIIRAGPYSALLLPQVAVEYGWDVDTFLQQVCMKAGLAMNSWENVNYQVYKFQAEIFKEDKKKNIRLNFQ